MAEQELLCDLRQGTLRPARHGRGPLPEHTYIKETALVDMVDFPGSNGYREVLCVLMGINKIDRAFPVALVLEKVRRMNEYQRVGTVAIDTRQISVDVDGSGDRYNWSDNIGEIRTLTIV